MGVDTKWLAKQQETQMDNPCLELWYEQRIEELEAKLAKALLIIEAYGDDEGYIPKRVVHLWNELTGGKDD